MGLITSIVVGAIVGWLASIIAKTNDQMGCLWNIVIGVIGAALGSWLAIRLGLKVQEGLSLMGFLVSLGGAVVLIILLRAIGILRRDR